MTPIALAAVLAGVVVLASMMSVELGISVALLELGLGVVAGNVFGLDPNTAWLVFIGGWSRSSSSALKVRLRVRVGLRSKPAPIP